MNTFILKSAFAIALFCSISSFSSMAQEIGNDQHYNNIGMGIGPVVSISENYNALPASAKTFISKYYPNATPTKITKKTFENIFKVELSNGYELSFYINGNWMKVEAPDGSNIPANMLKDLLPADTYKYITLRKMESAVCEIKHEVNRGYKVEFNDLYFDQAGKPTMPPVKN